MADASSSQSAQESVSKSVSESASESIPEFAAEAKPALASALTLRGLRQLLFAPSKFFAQPQRLGHAPTLQMLAWIAGVAYVMNQIDSKLMQHELLGSGMLRVPFASQVLHVWSAYWVFTLAGGIVSGSVLWLLAAWWYEGRGHCAPSGHIAGLRRYSTRSRSQPCAASASTKRPCREKHDDDIAFQHGSDALF